MSASHLSVICAVAVKAGVLCQGASAAQQTKRRCQHPQPFQTSAHHKSSIISSCCNFDVGIMILLPIYSMIVYHLLHFFTSNFWKISIFCYHSYITVTIIMHTFVFRQQKSQTRNVSDSGFKFIGSKNHRRKFLQVARTLTH